MAHSDTGICYECDAECVGAVFCGFGGQDSPDVRLPKVLNVVIEANPEFWGFPGVLFSGDITYSSSKFDYWNQFEENHLEDKRCGDNIIRDLNNELRPDVQYRSVYDPDTGTITYSGNTEINELGGPSVYLIDRDATKFTDAASCDENDPDDVFRFHPENFGFGNKILFEEDIYKNISAAWRGADTGIPNFTFNESGLPDGAVVGQYTGNVTGVYRDTATDPFIHLQVQYTGGQASAIRNGQILYLNSTCANQAYESQYLPDGAYYLTKVTDNGSYTDCALVGSVGTENFSESLTSSTWTIAGSLDEQTCRSRRAHGVDYENKCAELDYNYHADLGVVINDSRNRIHSNRKTRDKFGISNIRSADDKPRRDYTYVSVQESGYGLLVKEEETDNVALVCETGIWHPTWDFIYTSGDDYYSAFKPEDLFSVSGYHSDAPSTLVNIGSGLILTCGCTSGEPLGLCDISTGCLPLGWSKYFVSNGVYPMYGRELPFYGPFYEVYEHDNAVRNWQQDNTIKARNQTCYTPLATLEVYPDCITQENNYQYCNGGYTNLINNVSRLAFVYRCFDYQEPCSYDESGLPYNGMPTNIDQLRQGLAGQEVYMYINWGDVWAGEIKRDPCGCGLDVPLGNKPPTMMSVKSPVTFPCFPKFDLYPETHGTRDEIWKRYAAQVVGDYVPGISCPSDLPDIYDYKQQPYTTYGFIRNVCGKETNSSKAVIQALNDVNAGTYRNTTPLDDTIEPMYWEFPLVAGDLDGAPVTWNSGLYDSFVNDSGTLATWGIVDGNNRLVAPYYPVASGEVYTPCPPIILDHTYAAFDQVKAFKGEWPTSGVPFLISIDHNNNCVGCGTLNMSTDRDLQVRLTSLSTDYYHNPKRKDYTSTYEYGYNDCGYGQGIHDPLTYNCNHGWSSGWVCSISPDDHMPHTGETCDCVDGITIPLRPSYLRNTSIPKYWSSYNESNPLNGFIALTGCNFPSELFTSAGGGTPGFPDDPLFDFGLSPISTPYALFTLSCGNNRFFNGLEYTYTYRLTLGPIQSTLNGEIELIPNPLAGLYSCGTCSHSYPAVNNRPDLQIDWYAVNRNSIGTFLDMPTEQILTDSEFLCNGLWFDWGRMIDGYSIASIHDNGVAGYIVSHTGGCYITTSGIPVGDTNLPACGGTTITLEGCRWTETSPGYYGNCGFYWGGCGSGNDGLQHLGCNEYTHGSLFDDSCITSGCSWTYDINGVPVEDWEFQNAVVPPVICGCNCIGQYDEYAKLTYHDESNPYIHNGNTYYGWIADSWECADLYQFGPIRSISGSGIPFLGTIDHWPISFGGPYGQSIACHIHTSHPTAFCAWKDDVDPNSFTYVDHRIVAPGKEKDVDFPGGVGTSPCGSLWPNYCDENWGSCSGDPQAYRSTCWYPIYSNPSVRVRRKRAYPEIMTVHKIDCLGEGNGYNLHVSREYHNHSRAWYYPLDGYTCATYKGAIRGGGYNWRIAWTGEAMDPTPCPKFPYHPCSSDFAAINCVSEKFCFPTGDGWGLEGPVPGYYPMDHSVPSDQVTPAYPTINNSAISTSQSLCANHPHSGNGELCDYTRDFTYDEQPYKAAYTEWFPQQTGVPVPYPLYGNCSGLFAGYNGFADQDAILYADTLGASYANNALVELALRANCQITGTGYKTEYEDWYLPKYTGIIDPEDSSFGGICGIIGNTGEAVRTWYQGETIALSLCDQQRLEPTDEYVYYLASGCSGCACSGYTWAESGEYTPYELFRLEDENTLEYTYYTVLSPTGLCNDIRRRHPDLKDQTFWNYYNLFYGSGYPDDRFYNYVELIPKDPEGDCNDPGRHLSPWNFYPTQGGPPSNTDDPHFGPIYDDAIDIPLNRRHSCIQDSTQCGGELWNNKMFFPRKPYEAGTRVTAFGALSICTQDTTYEEASWLEGYEDLRANGRPDILREALNTRFIDACDTDAHSVTLQSSAGIDDVIIHVSDYLPLLGMYFVDRKMNLGDYTCLQPDSGCYDFLPIHSDQTLDKMSFSPKNWSDDKEVSFGYFLDKLVTDAQDQCLFKPFKIMVDVDCCPDNIRKIGQEDDAYEPTFMQWIDTTAPSLGCNAISGRRSCDCTSTQCGDIEDESTRKYPNAYIDANSCVQYFIVDPIVFIESGDMEPFYYDSGFACCNDIDCKGTGLPLIDGGWIKCESQCVGSIYTLWAGPDFTLPPISSGITWDPPDTKDCFYEYWGCVEDGCIDGEYTCEVEPGVPGCDGLIIEDYTQHISPGFSYIYYYDIPNCGAFNILGSGVAGAYRCGDAYYTTPMGPALLRGSLDDCCDYGSVGGVCGLLANSVKLTDSGCVLEVAGSGSFNNSADYVNCPCAIPGYPQLSTCQQDHNLLITIEEI